MERRKKNENVKSVREHEKFIVNFAIMQMHSEYGGMVVRMHFTESWIERMKWFLVLDVVKK